MVVVGAMFEGVGLRYQLYINHTQPYTENKKREEDLSSVHRDPHEPWCSAGDEAGWGGEASGGGCGGPSA